MPNYDFELILSRPLLEAELDPLFQLTHGLVTVGFVRELRGKEQRGQAGCRWQAPSLSAAIMEVIELLESLEPPAEDVPPLRVLSVEADPLLSMRDIAERVGRSLESVRLCIRGTRGPGNFPPSETTSAGHRLWRWSRVAAWYGVEDPQLHEAGPTSQAINGWLALRDVVPQVAPAPEEVTSALSAVLSNVA
ncbi:MULTISPECIES: hypothetical protein [Thermomonospora]|uniref:Uncharacterized protein n=1 Tax=Thermomonospora curvata (strain ATCC 19995 / DSM 43183 / JCM 3096 / KCTC 9072 / NBRC 15933 / NCIMB 10081 / Henssen B9) TaxID=471852 RepID=D1A353_THECD|nr:MULTISPECIES: hypothetical protein [Thermomonospora]ACY99823.1 hypothetical protein Tcur_4296 [Thermomonospora curvata DSM 43183]PKK12827.1 MAG: hypothetical protein BUE48_021100 [Thermomonospora sp. CIF 1]